VERSKVEIYAQLANTLFENLFGVKLVQKVSDSTELFGEFMVAWRDLEVVLNEKFPNLDTHRPVTVLDMIRILGDSGILSKQELKDLEGLRHVRNSIAHARPTPTPLSPELIQRLNGYVDRIRKHTG